MCASDNNSLPAHNKLICSQTRTLLLKSFENLKVQKDSKNFKIEETDE